MQVLETNLFTQISTEESANVNGGANFNLTGLIATASVITVAREFNLSHEWVKGLSFLTLAGFLG